MRNLILCLLLLAPSAFGEEDAGPEAEKNEISIEEFLQSLSTVPGLFTMKDPFAEAAPPFQVPTADTNPNDNGPVPGAPVLERYAVSDYEVVAVLLGDKYPRALLRLPPEGQTRKVVIVREGDKLGNRKGVIAKVTPEGLLIQQTMRSKHGFVDKTDVLLKVGGVAEQQRNSLTPVNSGR